MAKLLVSDGTGTLNVIVWEKSINHVKPEMLKVGQVRKLTNYSRN